VSTLPVLFVALDGVNVMHPHGDAISARPRAYKRRNVIERLFCSLKNWRRVATRYDRLTRNYLSGLALAAIIIAWT
jgi:transposase